MIEGNYRVEYISCTCPKCKKKIILKIYTKAPILMAEIAENPELLEQEDAKN
jgi:hypothetical protein